MIENRKQPEKISLDYTEREAFVVRESITDVFMPKDEQNNARVLLGYIISKESPGMSPLYDVYDDTDALAAVYDKWKDVEKHFQKQATLLSIEKKKQQGLHALRSQKEDKEIDR